LVPATLNTLRLRYDIRRCEPTSPYGNAQVLVDGQHVYNVATSPTVWQTNLHDIASFAGDGSIEIKFLVPAQFGNRHCMLIDNVEISTDDVIGLPPA
jgi:hypothetical protein